MKEVDIKDIKKISFEILCDVHDFCVKHDIHYSLSYGTLLGAIRHKGFIPWDDDIDIMMPRADYEKFCKMYESKNGYQCVCAQKGGYWSAYARICDTDRTIVHSPAPMGSTPNGVWIDLFVIDGAEEDKELFNKHAQEAKQNYADLLSQRFMLNLAHGSFISKLKFLIFRLIWKSCVKQKTWQYIDCCRRVPYGSTSYVSDFSCVFRALPKRHNVSIFDKYILREFEGEKFCVIADYDSFLTNIYGNYMQSPPVEERVPYHSAHKYFWK